MAEWLAERFPREQEGDLGRRLAYLVSQPVLAGVAETVGLAARLSVSPGEAKAGVAKRATVLADALEAALGALYLDGGLDAARDFVRRAWNDAMIVQADPPKDAKTALQEWAQKRGLDLPAYVDRPSVRAAARAGVHRQRNSRIISRHRHRRQPPGGRTTGRGSPPRSAVSMSQPPPARCGFIAIVGAPNAGKSTLMNRLTGAKLSIVSPKAQTTRFRVLGILMRAESQVLLVDTPGIFRPKRKLDRAMVAAAWSGAADADLAILLVDAKSGLREDVREIAERLGASGRRCWLVLNKTDLMSPPALLPLIASLGALANFEETFMVSAQTGDGVRRLADALAAAVPVGPWLFPEDDLTDLPDRLLAAETVREQIFMQTHEEVPYGATVETESFKERKDGSVRIEITIYVGRSGHKAILIGDKGSKIKAIGARARQDLNSLLDRPVHLFLNVKERKGWDEEGARLRAIGLEDPGRA